MESESDDEFFDADEDFKSTSASPKKEENVEPEQEISAVKKVEDQIKNSSNNSVIDTRKEFQDMIDKDHEITEIQTKPRTPPLNRDVAGTPEKVGESETDFKMPKVYIEEDIVDEICTFNEPDSLKIAATDVNCSIVTSESHEPQSLEKTKSELEIISENNIKKAEFDKSEEVNPNTSQTSLKQESTDITETPETKNPVAPPRRKKKQGKLQGPPRPPPPRPGDPPQRLAPSTNAGDAAPPCIKVSGSRNNEMNKILQQGSSLDVVYNVDTQANKSEGGMGASATGTLSTPKKLTDDEILEQVVIKNLDTGETIPLSKAEEKIPEGMSPLALHIMRLTIDNESEFVEMEEDGHLSDTSTTSSLKATGKRKKLKKFFGEAVQKIKHVADEVKAMRAEESSEEEEDITEGGYIKFKNHRLMKEKLSFSNIKLLQDLTGDHIGAIWTMKFSLCGKLLATAGQDNIVRVWVLNDAYSNFEEMRLKYSRPGGNNNGGGRTSPTGSMISANSVTSADEDPCIPDLLLANGGEEEKGPFKTTPFVAYHGHTSDVLDLSWSKNFFLLSSSMDKTVRLWHISRQECLCCFQHVDFVTAICFHPRDDRYFLSGSLDGKIRLWNIPEKKVALWNEIDGSGTSLITAANFCQNGKLAVVGTYDGRCIFYDTERLKYHTQITVRSSRGKNARGRKISGIEPMPGQDKVLITSNDSRIRLYDLKDHSLYCKYKGLHNESSQIRASFSHDGELILCGSEDKFVHIWRTEHGIPNVRKDRNEYYESFSAHEAVVTAAIFAPYPAVILPDHPTSKENDSKTKENDSKSKENDSKSRENDSKTPFDVLVSADWQGGIKLYVNR